MTIGATDIGEFWKSTAARMAVCGGSSACSAVRGWWCSNGSCAAVLTVGCGCGLESCF